MDWGDGSYELTAAVLAPASEAVVAAARVRPGEVVLDVGAGTGNAALAIARAGAVAIGVDPAPRLLHVAGHRASDAGLVVRLLPGTSTDLPVNDGEVDAAVSVFGVIFEPDGERAAREFVRAVRPGGRVVLAIWDRDSPIVASGQLLRQAVMAVTAGSAVNAGSPVTAGSAVPGETDWFDLDQVCLLFVAHGASVAVTWDNLAFTADSAADWFAQQQEHHPAWRASRAALPTPDWERVRAQSIALLEQANESPDGWIVRSGYWVVRADLP